MTGGATFASTTYKRDLVGRDTGTALANELFQLPGEHLSNAPKFVATASFMTSVLGLSDAIYNGIDRATYDSWEGNVVNAFGAALSLTNIRALKDAVFERAEDEESNLCINSTKTVAAYEALLAPAQRFVPPRDPYRS